MKESDFPQTLPEDEDLPNHVKKAKNPIGPVKEAGDW